MATGSRFIQRALRALLGGNTPVFKSGALVLAFVGWSEKFLFSRRVWEGYWLSVIASCATLTKTVMRWEPPEEVEWDTPAVVHPSRGRLCRMQGWVGCWLCRFLSVLIFPKTFEQSYLKSLKSRASITAGSLSSEEILGESESWKVGQGFFDSSSV